MLKYCIQVKSIFMLCYVNAEVYLDELNMCTSYPAIHSMHLFHSAINLFSVSLFSSKGQHSATPPGCSVRGGQTSPRSAEVFTVLWTAQPAVSNHQCHPSCSEEDPFLSAKSTPPAFSILCSIDRFTTLCWSPPNQSPVFSYSAWRSAHQ